MFGAAHVLLTAHSAHVLATILGPYFIDERLIVVHLVVFKDDLYIHTSRDWGRRFCCTVKYRRELPETRI